LKPARDGSKNHITSLRDQLREGDKDGVRKQRDEVREKVDRQKRVRKKKQGGRERGGAGLVAPVNKLLDFPKLRDEGSRRLWFRGGRTMATRIGKKKKKRADFATGRPAQGGEKRGGDKRRAYIIGKGKSYF